VATSACYKQRQTVINVRVNVLRGLQDRQLHDRDQVCTVCMAIVVHAVCKIPLCSKRYFYARTAYAELN